tara:strand:+ start:304 stop:2088 length:1785 start_codon:yes stop_codon:yes gene_type:complete
MKLDSERLRSFIRIEGHLSPQGSEQNYFFLKRVDGLTQVFNCNPSGSWPKQLTFFEEGVESYWLSPCGTYIAATVNNKGSEHGPIALTDLRSGVTRIIFQMMDAQSGAIVWSKDGSSFLFRSNFENKRDFKIYEYVVAEEMYFLRIDFEGWGYPIEYSSCGQFILYGSATSGANQELYLFDVENGCSEHLTPHEGQNRYEAAFAGSPGHLFILSDWDSEFKQLYTFDISSSTMRKVGGFCEWDSGGLKVSRDANYVAYSLNEGGYSRLLVIEVSSGSELPIPEFRGVLSSYQFTNNNEILLAYQNSVRSSDCYLTAIGGNEFTQLTFSSYQGLSPNLFVEPKLIQYTSFDGLQIPAFLFLPQNYQSGSRIPMVLHFHGGPEGQFRPIFYKHLQYLLELGIGVCAPNIRGSSGYGARYMAMDDYRKRPDSIRDGVELAKFVAAEGFTSFDKLGVVGGSYGGYMVLALITEAPDLFAAAVNVVGISNLVTFLKNTKPYRRKLREAEYGPLSDEEFLASISPIHKMERVKTPLLVVHGKTDPRVPISEAEQLVGELKKSGKMVESLFFEDEGHGIRKLSNQMLYFESMVQFFLKNIF